MLYIIITKAVDTLAKLFCECTRAWTTLADGTKPGPSFQLWRMQYVWYKLSIEGLASAKF
jgi:hypothetical protein